MLCISDQLPHWALSAMKCLAYCKYPYFTYMCLVELSSCILFKNSGIQFCVFFLFKKDVFAYITLKRLVSYSVH